MIQFVSQPYPCSFSKNPIPFKVHATNYSAEINIYPSITLTVQYQVLEGRFFVFEYINPDTGKTTEARFLADVNPELDGYEVPGNALPAQAITQQYVDDLAAHIRADRELSSYYTVVVDGSDIIITARQPIQDLIPTQWYLNDESSGMLGYAIIDTISTTYWKALPRTGLRVNLKVYFEKEYGSNQFEVVSEQTDTVDENGYLDIDISSIIDSEIRNSFIEPPLADNIPVGAANKTQKGKVLRRFYIEASEQWRNMSPEVSWQSSDTRFAHFGGVSMDDFSRENPIEYLHAEKMPLTWWPTKKKLYDDYKDWLSLMNTYGVDKTISAHLEILYKDGTSDAFNLGDQELLPWETITVPVGYQQLNIPNIQDLNKEVYGWKISFKDNSTTLIHERQYLFVQPENFTTKTLVYLNSFGVPESFVTYGFWDNELQTSSQLASRTLSHDYKSINGQDFVFSKNSKHLFTVRTGSLTKKEKKALQDMLNVAPVFLVDNGHTVPVIVDTGSFNIDQEEEIIETLEFTLAKSMQLKNISHMIKKPSMVVTESCGMFTVKIESEDEISTFNDLQVTQIGSGTFETVAHDGNSYPLTNKVEEAGVYYFEAEVVIDGVTFSLIKKVFFKRKQASFDSPDHQDPINWSIYEINSAVSETIYTDFEDGNIITTNLLANTNVNVIAEVPKGVKKQTIESSCLDNINEFRVANQEYSNFELQEMNNLKVLEISNNSLSGHFSTAHLKSLEVILMEDNNITSFEVGLLVNLYGLMLVNCQLDAQAIEDLAEELWKYRNVYNVLGVMIVNVGGNPGVPNITQKTLQIKNGTGVYAGDGLVQHDILLIY